MSLTQSEEHATACKYDERKGMNVNNPTHGIENNQSSFANAYEYRNILEAPIHGFPEEVLTTAFSLALAVADGQAATFDHLQHGRDIAAHTAQLLTLSHVCRRWPDVTLRFPALWTRIDGRNANCFKTFLERSHCLPVSVLTSNLTEDLEDLLNTNGHLLRRLDIAIYTKGDKSDREDVLPILCRVHIPALTCLTISAGPGGSICEHDPVDNAPTLFKSSSECTMRALALQLTYWTPMNTFPYLTHLELSEHLYHDDPSYLDILTLLNNAPKLQHLTVIGLPSWQLGYDVENEVILSDLRSATFIRCVWDIPYGLLKLLRVPTDARVRVMESCDPERTLDDGWYMEPAPFLMAEGLTRMSLVLDTHHQVHLTVGNSDDGALFRIEHTDDTEDGEWLRMMLVFMASATITSLEITILPSAWEEDGCLGLCALVGGLTHLQDLRITARCVENPIPLLSICITLGLQPVQCPNLVSVHIDTSYPDLSRLAKAAIARANMGHSLHHLAVVSDRRIHRQLWTSLETCRDHVDEVEIRDADNRDSLPRHKSEQDQSHVNGADEYWTHPSEARLKLIQNPREGIWKQRIV